MSARLLVALWLLATCASAVRDRAAVSGPYRPLARVSCAALTLEATTAPRNGSASATSATSALVRAWGALVHDDLADNGALDASPLYGCAAPRSAAALAPAALRDALVGALARFHIVAESTLLNDADRFERARARTIAAWQRATVHDFARRVLGRPAAAASDGVGGYGSALAALAPAPAVPFRAFLGPDERVLAQFALGDNVGAALLSAAAATPASVGALDAAALDAALLGVRARDRYWYEWHLDGAHADATMETLAPPAPAERSRRARDAPPGDDAVVAVECSTLDGWMSLAVPALSALLLLGVLLLLASDRANRGSTIAPHADDPSVACQRCADAAAHLAAAAASAQRHA